MTSRLWVFQSFKDALKTLNRIDKSLRREITKDYKRLTQGVVDDAYQAIPLRTVAWYGKEMDCAIWC
jgi:hypothetical protein